MARTEGQWMSKGTYLIPAEDIPVVLKNGYLNFGGTVPGDLGYGFRDNAGTIQAKNSGGAWSTLALLSPSGNIALGSNYLSGDGDDEGISIDGAGKVAIGTTGESLKIGESGNTVTYIRMRDSGTYGSSIGYAPAYNGLLLQSGLSKNISFAVNSGTFNSPSTATTAMTITSAGQIGIGADSPASKLHVYAGTARLLVESTGTSDATFDLANAGVIKWRFGLSNNAFFIRDQDGNGEILRIEDGAPSNSLRIKSSTGNVGIGTHSPASLLTVGSGGLFQVNSSGAIAAATGINVSGSTGADISLNSSNSNAAHVIELQNTAGGGIGTSATVELQASFVFASRNAGKIVFGQDNTYGTLSNSDGNLQLYTALNGGNIQRLRIDSKGDTTFYKDDGSTAGLTFDASSGYVGIGTTTPTAKLQVGSLGTVGVSHEVNAFVAGGIETGKLVIGYGQNPAVIRTDDASKPITFIVGGYERVRIVNSSGNVGIGTTSPVVKLDVNGALSVRGMAAPADPTVQTALLYQDSTTSDLMCKVSDGTTTKSVTLIDYSSI